MNPRFFLLSALAVRCSLQRQALKQSDTTRVASSQANRLRMPGLVLPLRAVAKLLVNNILQSGGFEHVRFQKMTAADAPADGTPCSVAAELRRVFAAQEARATEYNKFRRYACIPLLAYML